MTPADRCQGPDCTEPVAAGGLCTGHYQQRRRGAKALRPLRGGPAKEVVTLRVGPDAAKAARKDYAGAVGAVERWAAGKGTDAEARAADLARVVGELCDLIDDEGTEYDLVRQARELLKNV